MVVALVTCAQAAPPVDKAGERLPAPAAMDVDVSINGNGVINPE